MRQTAPFLAAPLLLLAMALPAQAACVAEYKAKRDQPFELHYDTVRITGACTLKNAEAQLRRKLAGRGLVLLKVMSVKES